MRFQVKRIIYPPFFRIKENVDELSKTSLLFAREFLTEVFNGIADEEAAGVFFFFSFLEVSIFLFVLFLFSSSFFQFAYRLVKS